MSGTAIRFGHFKTFLNILLNPAPVANWEDLQLFEYIEKSLNVTKPLDQPNAFHRLNSDEMEDQRDEILKALEDATERLKKAQAESCRLQGELLAMKIRHTN